MVVAMVLGLCSCSAGLNPEQRVNHDAACARRIVENQCDRSEFYSDSSPGAPRRAWRIESRVDNGKLSVDGEGPSNEGAGVRKSRRSQLRRREVLPVEKITDLAEQL
jgi:hypothetical protein